ncbi:MAG: ABC transporter permease [Bacteroidales bacterium]
MNVTLELIRKEFLQIIRNKLIMKIIIMAPILQLIILVYAANFEIKHLNMGVIDRDNTELSLSLKNSFVSSGYFKLKNIEKDYTEGLKEFDREKVDIIIEIPNNFEQDLKKGTRPGLFIAVNAINSMKAGVSSSYIAKTMATYYKSETFQRVIKTTSTQNSSQINVEYSDWYNPQLNYKSYMLPGILCIIITIMGILLTALNVVREKEVGTIEQLNVIPITKAQFIIGKLVPFFIIGILQFTLGILIAISLFRLQIVGSIPLLYLMISVYLLVVLGIGFLISNISETQTQSIFVSLFFMFIFILMSGLFTPVESMPVWAQKISMINPAYYMVDTLRLIILKGSNFANVFHYFLILLGMAIIINFAIFRVYKKVS